MWLAMVNETLDAPRALELGLVNRVVPNAELGQAVADFARQLASGPTGAFGRWKVLLRTAHQNSLDDHLDMEKEGFLASAGTHDFQEGCAALLERRKPSFKGH